MDGKLKSAPVNILGSRKSNTSPSYFEEFMLPIKIIEIGQPDWTLQAYLRFKQLPYYTQITIIPKVFNAYFSMNSSVLIQGNYVAENNRAALAFLVEKRCGQLCMTNELLYASSIMIDLVSAFDYLTWIDRSNIVAEGVFAWGIQWWFSRTEEILGSYSHSRSTFAGKTSKMILEHLAVVYKTVNEKLQANSSSAYFFDSEKPSLADAALFGHVAIALQHPATLRLILDCEHILSHFKQISFTYFNSKERMRYKLFELIPLDPTMAPASGKSEIFVLQDFKSPLDFVLDSGVTQSSRYEIKWFVWKRKAANNEETKNKAADESSSNLVEVPVGGLAYIAVVSCCFVVYAGLAVAGGGATLPNLN